MTIAKLIERWEIFHLNGRVKLRTRYRYTMIAHGYIESYLGREQLVAEVTEEELKTMVACARSRRRGMEGMPLSRATLNLIIAVTKSIFGYAKHIGTIVNDPSRGLKRYKPRNRVIEVFTPLEQQLLEDYGNINFSAPVSVVMICLYTGMRIGEALGLRWGDIDKHERTIRVQRERCYALGDDGKWQVFTDTPKTFASAISTHCGTHSRRGCSKTGSTSRRSANCSGMRALRSRCGSIRIR